MPAQPGLKQTGNRDASIFEDRLPVDLVQNLHYYQAMPTVHRGDNWKLTMYAEDHNPPHFHVMTPNATESISIDTLETISGQVPAKIHREACEWAEMNRAALIAKWEELKRRHEG